MGLIPQCKISSIESTMDSKAGNVCPSHMRPYTSASPVAQHGGPMVAVGMAAAGNQPVVKIVLLGAKVIKRAGLYPIAQ